jgi:hypothetical protein
MHFHARRWAWLAVCGVLAACGSSQTRTPGQARGAVDATTGSYAGATLGMTIPALQARLGDPMHTNDNPFYAPSQAPPLLAADNYHDWVYPDVGVTFVAGRVASLTVYGLGAATGRGTGIGDPLSDVRQAYPGARCQPARGGVNPQSPGCAVTAGRDVYLYFSGSPIKLIGLSSYPYPALQ